MSLCLGVSVADRLCALEPTLRRLPQTLLRHNVPVAESEDDAIEELFQAPLNEFTAKRNALLKTVRGADATRIRTLTKPSVAAWAVNQVYWRARPVYDRLIKSGDRLRRAQLAALEGKPADVRSASDAHRRAVTDAVAEADRIARSAGSKPATDALMRTFEALSLAAKPAEHPGRLAEALQPAGFEALTGITPKAQPPQSHTGRDRHAEAALAPALSGRALPHARASPGDKERERERKREEAAAARQQAAQEKKREAERSRRQAAVDRAKILEAKARADWEEAQRVLREAEERLARV
jgi:hypothetical protein